jgi:putative transposase
MSKTYFITAITSQRRPILQSDQLARLLIDVLMSSRKRGILVHEFVVMPEHLHALITAELTIERVMQYVKGGFSFRAKRDAGFNGAVWQAGYHDRRVRDLEEFDAMRRYIHENPVRRRLVQQARDWPWGSASGSFPLDGLPQGLKPRLKSTP